MKDYFKIL